MTRVTAWTMTTTVIVDDSSPPIIYSDGWTLGGDTGLDSNEYNGTVHQAASNGLHLTYPFTGMFTPCVIQNRNGRFESPCHVFSGSQISVYGTLDSPAVNGIATSTYSIDNISSITTVYTGENYLTIPDLQSHLLLYQSPVVSDGPHTLTITVSNITNGSPKYYLDFFVVDVSTLENTSQVIVDDTSQEVNYVGNWTESHAFNEYLGTDHKAPSSGNANATYAFNGMVLAIEIMYVPY